MSGCRGQTQIAAKNRRPKLGISLRRHEEIEIRRCNDAASPRVRGAPNLVDRTCHINRIDRQTSDAIDVALEVVIQ